MAWLECGTPKTAHCPEYRHAKGPVNNIIVVRQPSLLSTRGSVNSNMPSVKRHGVSLAPPLEKYANSADDNDYKAGVDVSSLAYYFWTSFPHRTLGGFFRVNLSARWTLLDLEPSMVTRHLARQGSSAAAEMEIERLKLDRSRSMQMIQQWEKKFQSLHQFCVTGAVDGEQAGNA
ncbi:hypothetical protein HAX54_010019 [Datura stramonium]|uniref:Uncharacterized protein n=1 Tax=Datura stramonium TaxID=4076 RepID=A0ABS8THF3_DATST|nr:hypothetical protein [Datura stramonium]